ncbi:MULTISPECIES: hypothetical protein [Prauserella salsuginis group]|uniref:Uncharacterized protein n=2 Tax=Prauserella salsuginis group TaxID=2893672 RepID=A0A839XGF4_9PSEU|nr:MULTISPECIES: hypothetical protein [Prauserella salsuginis group]MBB3661841.1 hypothetical protein [Prauserella sediminis]MCR3722782.1 hypothetical protein [Prauserella flava]MCR3737163.1 hypothetical protein [Prauserella salsuginis]
MTRAPGWTRTTAAADRTEPLETPVTEPDAPGAGGRAWRGFTGSVAAGFTLLAVVVLVVALATDGGPGMAVVVWHLLGAVAALALQVVLVDRGRGPAAGLAGVGVVGLAGIVLWTCWWA